MHYKTELQIRIGLPPCTYTLRNNEIQKKRKEKKTNTKHCSLTHRKIILCKHENNSI